ncbi:MAG: LLM class flavin-dependent oxidoreductase [Chloroflexi bacterium]|nr:LLM class flavin-dependent oxidoreductase [Chloroflexota bacterium]
MRIGVHLIPDDWTTFLDRARYADQAGYGNLWIAESHLTVNEVFAAVQAAAMNTSRVAVGPGCTNVVLRHETVVAAGLASINALVGGRVVVGLGSGDTPVGMVGRKPSRVAELRQSVQNVQALVSGQPVRYGVNEVTLTWSHQPLPVYVFAEGPRMLEMGGEVGDGVLAGNGISEPVVSWVRERVQTGANRVGRSVQDVDLWYACMMAVEDSREKARDIMRARVANRARHNFLAAPQLIPPQRRSEADALIASFDLGKWFDPKHAPLVTDFMLDRFAVTGTPDQVVEQLEHLESLGVRNLMIDLPMERYDATLRTIGEKVLPRIS